MSEGRGKLYAALAKAQGQIRGAIKDSTNPHFRSKYADLASTWEACRKALSENGLAVMQLPMEAPVGFVRIITHLGHASGASIESDLTLPTQKGDIQGYGSAITYARRYALAAMVGVAPEDDDGNSAVDRDYQGPPAHPQDGHREAPAPTLEDLLSLSVAYGEQLRSAKDVPALNGVASRVKKDKARLGNDLYNPLEKIYQERFAELKSTK